MIIHTIILSLQITAIYVCFMEGMIFGEIRIYLLQKTPKHKQWIFKPIFDCLICMGGIYSLALGYIEFGLTFKELLQTMIAVIGLNTLIDCYLSQHT